MSKIEFIFGPLTPFNSTNKILQFPTYVSKAIDNMQKNNRDWALPLPGDCCLFHLLATYNTATDVVEVIFLPFPYCRRVDLFPPRKFKIPTTAVL
jgi:hypothetical protein